MTEMEAVVRELFATLDRKIDAPQHMHTRGTAPFKASAIVSSTAAIAPLEIGVGV